ncbi:hypothetical protein ACOSP6_09610 [Tenacibaculum sp. MEBiC06402]|uniref:hypothetical protein n=1 Tax=unclassified Tenacibaculum TaxID=2635139 RepID=UPI003B9BE9FF
MKKLILLLFIPFFSFISKSPEKDIIGKWTGEDKGEIGFMTFDEDGYLTMEFNGKKMGGKDFLYRGKKAKATYRFKSKTAPYQIDIVISDIDDNVIRSMYCLAEFKDKNTMKFGISQSSYNRSKKFEDYDSILLTRVK